MFPICFQTLWTSECEQGSQLSSIFNNPGCSYVCECSVIHLILTQRPTQVQSNGYLCENTPDSNQLAFIPIPLASRVEHVEASWLICDNLKN